MYNQPNQGGFCPKCGKAYVQGTAFCQGCGTNLAPQPAPQPQFVQPQPQYVAPQPAPQPQYVAPQPQPQYAAPAPQPQYAAPAPAPKAKDPNARPLWKLLGSIFLFVAVLMMAILPLFGFVTYDYDFPAGDEYDEWEEEYQEEMEAYGVFTILIDEDFSIINAFEDFIDEMDSIEERATRYEYDSYYGFTSYVNEELVLQYTFSAIYRLAISIIIFVGTLIFLIATQIYAIKSIIAFCKKDYAALSKYTFATLGRFLGVFIMFSIYTHGGLTYLEEDEIARFGLTMAPVAVVALVLALCLIVANVVVSTIFTKKSLAKENRANFFKTVAVFAGSLILVIIALSQKAQVLLSYVVNSFFLFEDDSDRIITFIFALGMLILYTAVTKKFISELSDSGMELVYFSQESEQEIVASKLEKPATPNILANGIFLLLIVVADYVINSIEDPYLILDPVAIIAMMVIAIGVYVAYKVLGSVLKPKPAAPVYAAPQPQYAPAQQYAPQPQFVPTQAYAPVAPAFEDTASVAPVAPVFEETAPAAEEAPAEE